MARTPRHRTAYTPKKVATAAVSEAYDVPDENLIGAEGVPVRAAGWWSGDPLAIRGLHQVAQHVQAQALWRQAHHRSFLPSPSRTAPENIMMASMNVQMLSAPRMKKPTISHVVKIPISPITNWMTPMIGEPT